MATQGAGAPGLTFNIGGPEIIAQQTWTYESVQTAGMGGDIEVNPQPDLVSNNSIGLFEGGVDPFAGVAASITVNNVGIERKDMPVQIIAEQEGKTGNVTLTGNDNKTVAQLVQDHNANPNNAQLLPPLQGGDHVLNAGETITLTGGRDWYAKSHGCL